MRQPLLALCFLLALTGAQAQAYRWTDNSGKTVISDTPPPGKARDTKTMESQQPSGEEDLPYASRRAAERYPVTLYVTPDCGQPCNQARDLLRSRKAPFTEKKIETNAELAELRQTFGDDLVPAMKVGNQRTSGFMASTFNGLLDIAGYPAARGGK